MRKYKCLKSEMTGIKTGEVFTRESLRKVYKDSTSCMLEWLNDWDGSVGAWNRRWCTQIEEITQPTVKLVVEGLEIGDKVNIMTKNRRKADYCPYTWDGNTFIDNEGDKIMHFRLAKLISGEYDIERIEEPTEEQKKLEEIEQSIVEQKEATAKLEKQAKELREMIDRD